MQSDIHIEKITKYADYELEFFDPIREKFCVITARNKSADDAIKHISQKLLKNHPAHRNLSLHITIPKTKLSISVGDNIHTKNVSIYSDGSEDNVISFSESKVISLMKEVAGYKKDNKKIKELVQAKGAKDITSKINKANDRKNDIVKSIYLLQKDLEAITMSVKHLQSLKAKIK